MESKHAWKVFMFAWLGTAASVIAGIYITHSAICLWALVFPLFISAKAPVVKQNDDEGGNDEL
jgi:hypothetical protein